MPEQKFTTEAGLIFGGISVEKTKALRSSLFNTLNLSLTHATEAASYSQAMVSRFALGLSADKADVCVLVNETLAGVVALATARHLVNAGSAARLFIFQGGADDQKISTAFSSELAILEAMEISAAKIDVSSGLSGNDIDLLNSAILGSHSVICGLFDADLKVSYPMVVELLNEAPTPVHSVDSPLGIDPDTGSPRDTPLFASSTLSLGTVYSGLFNGNSYAGRHYLCDISITRKLYETCGYDLTPLFSEQPVVRINPKTAEENGQL